ncbi:MAG: UDP-glucose 4-epimerase GalE [Clostridia bacterium]
MAVLVTGGAGYIGSHMVLELMEHKEDVVVVDNLSTGHRHAVLCDTFYPGDIRDDLLMERVFRENDIESVIHFAADSQVAESMRDPLKYYDNNVGGTARLLHHMVKHSVGRMVFSSTAAVYGEPDAIPITEEAPVRPQSAYGESKLSVERMLAWVSASHGIRHTCLRYFNACGAHRDGVIGEDHRPETHLIPNLVKAAFSASREAPVYGTDYPTPDGTCIRDYIYIGDLVKAHMLSLEKMRKENVDAVYNLGSQAGYSVLEILRAVEGVTGIQLDIRDMDRRPGDPAVLIASGEKARRELGFLPIKVDIGDIIETVVKFQKKHPGGYAPREEE